MRYSIRRRMTPHGIRWVIFTPAGIGYVYAHSFHEAWEAWDRITWAMAKFAG